jgi:ethanolamine ammonia-lyase small subunit
MSEIIQNPWTRLRSFTNARLALGRAGDSLPTQEVLRFGLAHAQARDAVHRALDVEGVVHELDSCGFGSVVVQSAARDRAAYLRRPDLGRRLDDASRLQLSANDKTRPVVFIIADGLSAIAPARHAVAVLREINGRLEDGLRIATVIVATQARVALGDEIGELLRAEMTVMLIGERPGLSSPDSLGIYLTYRPRIGCTDADRNCISNVRPEGLSYEAAAHKLLHLMLRARELGRSGVALKDESDLPRLP